MAKDFTHAFIVDDAIGYDAQASNKNVGSITLEIKQIKRVEVYGPNKVREPPKVIRGHRQEGDVCVRCVCLGSILYHALLMPSMQLRRDQADCDAKAHVENSPS